MDLHKWIIPHRDTHKRAHLLSWRAFFVYIIFFALLKVAFSGLSIINPDILGTTSNITKDRIIELTNVERGKLGLPPLSGNPVLDQAATAKAYNMFEENYWAHFAPSGKSPWDFMLGSGYKFSVAGENLAKSFSNPEEVVSAWMASPTHRENIINSKYKDIGIAIEDGVINGQSTTLVVQMFGTTSALASLPNTRNTNETNAKIPPPTVIPVEEYERKSEIALSVPAVAQAQISEPIINPFQLSKFFGIGIVTFISALLFIDFVILKRRGVFSLSSNHFAHMALLGVAAATLFQAEPGQIGSGIMFILK